MFQVTLATGRAFPADPAVSILDAGLRAGAVLSYSCRTGRCNACKAPVTAGETRALRHEESLTPDDMAAGLILTCCRAAASDVALDIEPLDRLSGIEIKTIPARIVSLEPLAHDIMRVTLRTPPGSALWFVPGQYVDLIHGGSRRSYSLANAPREDATLELIVRRYEGGRMSGYLFELAKPNDLVRIEGPLGTFFLRDDGPRNLLFLATGTGIAPVKALLEELAGGAQDTAARSIKVFWGNRHADGFFWNTSSLAHTTGFSMRQIVSRPDESWVGLRGHVQSHAMADGFDPADTAVYACGSPAMIESARAALCGLGLPERRFYADAFVSSN